MDYSHHYTEEREHHETENDKRCLGKETCQFMILHRILGGDWVKLTSSNKTDNEAENQHCSPIGQVIPVPHWNTMIYVQRETYSLVCRCTSYILYTHVCAMHMYIYIAQ